jgi:hypothetical protein
MRSAIVWHSARRGYARENRLFGFLVRRAICRVGIVGFAPMRRSLALAVVAFMACARDDNPPSSGAPALAPAPPASSASLDAAAAPAWQTVCGLIPRPHAVAPAFADGRPIGFKMFSIQSASMASDVGLQNGDIVTSINGVILSRFDSALEAAVGDCSRLTVDIRRDDQVLHLTWRRPPE